MRHSAVALVIISAACVWAATVTYTCPSSSCLVADLQAQINLLNNGDTLLAAGTFLDCSDALNLNPAAGITLLGNPSVTIDCEGDGYPLRVTEESGGADTIANFTFINGVADEAGGCISVRQSTLILLDCQVDQCSTATQGGGLYVTGGSQVTLKRTWVTNNFAHVGGGGLAAVAGSTITLEDVTLANNSADLMVGVGGAIMTMATQLTGTRVAFSNNEALLGGAFSARLASQISLVDSTFTSNTASVSGGAIESGASTLSIQGGYAFSNTATNGGAFSLSAGSSTQIASVMMTGNHATNGGGISFSGVGLNVTGGIASGHRATTEGGWAWLRGGGNVRLESMFLYGNTAGGAGGAVASEAVALVLNSMNVTANTALQGGAVYSNGVGAQLDAKSCAFVANMASTTGGALSFSPYHGSVTDSWLDNNSADRGGAMELIDGSTIVNGTLGAITGNIFSRNRAVAGGAVFIRELGDRSIATTLKQGNTFQNNQLTNWIGYGVDLASVPATLMWMPAPLTTLSSGDAIGMLDTSTTYMRTVVGVQVTDLLGAPVVYDPSGGAEIVLGYTIAGTNGVMVNASFMTPPLATFHGTGVAAFYNLIVLAGHTGAAELNAVYCARTAAFDATVLTCANAAQAVRVTAATTFVNCTANVSAATDMGLAYPICVPLPCPPGTSAPLGVRPDCTYCEEGSYQPNPAGRTCLSCDDNYYSAIGATACELCPDGGVCANGKLRRRDGFWMNPTDQTFYKCDTNPTACPGGTQNFSACAPGYEGFLCGECQCDRTPNANTPCFGRSFTQCQECKIVGHFFGVIIYLIFVVFMILLYTWLAADPQGTKMASMRVLLFYLQMLGLLSQYVAFADTLLPSLTTYSLITTFQINILPFSCVFGYSISRSVTFYLFAPLVAGVVVYGVSRLLILKNMGCPTRVKLATVREAFEYYEKANAAAMRTMLLVLIWYYPSQITTFFKAFFCHAANDTGRLYADTSITCWESTHTLTAIFAAVGLIGYGFGLPSWTFFVVVQSRSMRSHPTMMSRFKFLYGGYKDLRHTWTSWLLLREAGLSVNLVFAAFDGSVQLVGGVALMFVYILAHVFLRPIEHDRVNRAELVSLLTLFFTILGGALTRKGVLSFQAQAGVTGFLIFVNLIVAIGLVLFQFRRRVDRCLKRAPSGSASEYDEYDVHQRDLNASESRLPELVRRRVGSGSNNNSGNAPPSGSFNGGNPNSSSNSRRKQVADSSVSVQKNPLNEDDDGHIAASELSDDSDLYIHTAEPPKRPDEYGPDPEAPRGMTRYMSELNLAAEVAEAHAHPPPGRSGGGGGVVVKHRRRHHGHHGRRERPARPARPADSYYDEEYDEDVRRGDVRRDEGNARENGDSRRERKRPEAARSAAAGKGVNGRSVSSSDESSLQTTE